MNNIIGSREWFLKVVAAYVELEPADADIKDHAELLRKHDPVAAAMFCSAWESQKSFVKYLKSRMENK